MKRKVHGNKLAVYEQVSLAKMKSSVDLPLSRSKFFCDWREDLEEEEKV